MKFQSTLVLLCTCLFFAGCKQKEQRLETASGPVPISLTDEQKDLFNYIDNLTKENEGRLIYDLRDPKQHAFVKMMNGLSGVTEEAYPQTYKSLETLKAFHLQNGGPAALDTVNDGWDTSFDIPGLGKISASTPGAASNGMGTVVGGFNTMNLSIYVRDNNTGAILAYGSNMGFGPLAATPVATDDASALAMTNNVTAYLNWSYTLNDSSGNAGLSTRQFTGTPVADPAVTQPARNCTAPMYPNAINIGLGRQWGDQGVQFDYVWNQPAQDNPQGQVPFVGSVTFQSAIAPLQWTGTQRNATLNIRVVNTSTGGKSGQINPVSMQNVYNNFSISPSNSSTLVWNLPAGQNNLNTGNPITFGSIPWPSDMAAYFYCDIQVTLADGTLAFASIMSSPGQDTDPVDGVTQIMPIEFIWHCLAEGTEILIPGQKKLKVEKFKKGDLVTSRDLQGGLIQKEVVFTTKGVHKGSFYSITTEDGKTLDLSGNHIVMTTEGGLRVDELKRGDKVFTVNGTTAIKEIKQMRSYDGMVYGLSVTDNVPLEKHDGTTGVFFANGILVGDFYAQRYIRYMHLKDKEWIRKYVGEEWSKDIDSHFAKQQK